MAAYAIPYRDNTGLPTDALPAIAKSFILEHPTGAFGDVTIETQYLERTELTEESLIKMVGEGKLAVVREGNPNGTNCAFTTKEHFIFVYGYEDGMFLICDPYEKPYGHYGPLGSKVLNDSDNISKVRTTGAVLFAELENAIIFQQTAGMAY